MSQKKGQVSKGYRRVFLVSGLRNYLKWTGKSSTGDERSSETVGRHETGMTYVRDREGPEKCTIGETNFERRREEEEGRR